MRRASNVNTRLTRLRQSFRQGALQIGTQLRDEALHGLHKVRKVPRWLRILRTVYHDYGLKHVCLISILVIYQFMGAAIFYACEAGFDESKEQLWIANIRRNRTKFVGEIIPLMFNNSDYLFFLTQEQTDEVAGKLATEMSRYEKQLGIKYTDQKIKWDFWNAMLYAQTICTTIGYGHLYPSTKAGRIFTMFYAIFGIPLVLSILDDLGKLLTRCLKTPWWLIKCGCRRAFRYCTKQTMEEIKKLDDEDKRDLEIFDLPIPIAIFVVIAWIFVCSATFCIWEQDWDYFVAFYFFFISLSTIGLGDITPTEPKYLLMLFIYIIIGLSLVSMCINLIQAKLERTYDAGRQELLFERSGGLLLDVGGGHGKSRHIQRRGSALVCNNRPKADSSSRRRARRVLRTAGVFRSSSSVHSFTKESIQAAILHKKRYNKTSQTMLSFPSTTHGSVAFTKSVHHSRYKFLPRTLSIDDVMKLVDTEEGDILLLTELVREESGISDASNTLSDLSAGSQEIEEMEDRIALGQSTQLANSVQFRSRLSLIPEQHSVIEEVNEDSITDASALSPEGSGSSVASPPTRKKGADPRKTLLSNLLRRKSSKERTPQTSEA